MVQPVRVPLAQPLLLGASLKGGQAFRWRVLPAPPETYVGVAGGRAWWLRHADGALLARCAPALEPREAEAWVRRTFRLDDPYEAVGARLAREAELKGALEAWWGLRLLQTDPWECLLGFITSIHDSVAAIETRIGRLCRHFGAPFQPGIEGFARGWAHATPTPERIARAHEARLRGAAGMGFRARYLRGAARMVLDGDLPLAELASMRYDEAHEMLLQVPGVGDKVADCVQLYALGHLESFPVDRWIQRAMLERFYPQGKATPRAIAALAQQRWGTDAGYAQQFLFHDARLGKRVIRSRLSPSR